MELYEQKEDMASKEYSHEPQPVVFLELMRPTKISNHDLTWFNFKEIEPFYSTVTINRGRDGI